jgi:hypothetical protein
MLLAAGIAACLAFSACSTTGAQQLTPAQIATIVCPPIQTAMTTFQAIDASMPTVPAAVTAAALLEQAKAPVAAACTAGASITAINVTTLGTQVLPALGAVAGTLPIPVAQQAEVQAGLLLAETTLGVAGTIAQSVAAAKAAQAAASTPASAPLVAVPAASSE